MTEEDETADRPSGREAGPDDAAAARGPVEGEKSGTFLVANADDDSAVLSDVADGQVHPMGVNPGFEEGEVAAATIAPEGPLGVTWYPVEVAERWRPRIEAVDEPPGERARELADDPESGRLSRVPLEDGELHVVAVEAGRTDEAVEDVLADATTRRIAARLGARRVEVRGAAGVVGVRYLLDP